MKSRIVNLVVVAAVLMLAACSGESGENDLHRTELEGRSIEVIGAWSGSAERAFRVLSAAFERETGAKVDYVSAGSDLRAILQTRVDGRRPPDVAILPKPGLIRHFGEAGALKPLAAPVVETLDKNFATIWKQFGSFRGVPYGVYLKAENKSTLWFNKKLYRQAGVTLPNSVDALTDSYFMSSGKGIKPLSVGGAEGWVLVDLFQNIYLRSAGLANYDRLGRHEIPWTDSTVRDALAVMARILTSDALAGGTQGALRATFANSIGNVFGDTPKAAMVFEADSAGRGITSSENRADAGVIPFPAVNGSVPSAVVGGDAAVAFTDKPETARFLDFLASSEAARRLTIMGGFLSPNKNAGSSSYPDDLTSAMAEQLIVAGDGVRFGMSDSAPMAAGGAVDVGAGEILRDFLAGSADMAGVMTRLEAVAAKAHGK